jgi:Ras-related protein Rab-14
LFNLRVNLCYGKPFLLIFQEAFIETAKKIYQNIQDGSLDLNAAESGVQHKPTTGGNTGAGGGTVLNDSSETKESCNC